MLNISTSGCAFDKNSEPLSLKDKLLISIDLEGEDKIFEARGEVVRMKDGVIAVQYLVVEPEVAKLVRIYFSKRFRESKKMQREALKQSFS